MDDIDACSRTVSATVGPSVDAVRADQGSGSAVVVDDRLLITDAHIVEGHRTGALRAGDLWCSQTVSR